MQPVLTAAVGRLGRSRLTSRIDRRTALTAVFALNGFLFGSWAARIPDVTAGLNADHTLLGLALLCLSLGALLTMKTVGSLCARWGAGRLTVAGAALLSILLLLPAAAGSITTLAAGLLGFGAASGLLNVAMNSLGVQIETEDRRPLLPFLHAASSFGGLAGSLAGGLMALGTAPLLHLGLVGLAGLLVTGVAGTVLLPAGPNRPAAVDPDPAGERRRRQRTRLAPQLRRTIIILGVIAGCTAYAEGALSDWAALHLRTDLDSGPLIAAAAYGTFSLAMGSGRLLGAALLAAVGQTGVIVGGGVVAALGMTVAALTRDPVTALLCFAVVGFGLANIFPVAIARAGGRGGPNGVALASTIGYAGLLGGPPVIGFVSSHVGLPVALTTISLLATVAAVLAVVLRGSTSPGLIRSGWYRVAALAQPGTPVAVAALGVRLAAGRQVRFLADLRPVPGRPEQHRADGTTDPVRLPPYPGLDGIVG